MLLAFVLSALGQVFVFVEHPILGISLPLLLLVGALVYIQGWLSAIETLFYGAIGAYLVDAVSAFNPGSVLLSTLLALTVLILTRRRYNLPVWLSVLLTVCLYELSLWFLADGWFGRELALVTAIGAALALIGYGLLHVGVKQLEARL